MFLYVNAVIVEEKKLPYEEVYKKYLGPDYKCDIKSENYSLIICNHIGFFEVLINLARFVPGFIAKLPIKDYWFVGPIAQALNCLFVDRSKKEAREKIVSSFY